MSKVIGFVPARGGSVSIPLKNIKEINKKPLLYWTLKALEESNVDIIYLATDHIKIKEIALSFNFKKVEIYNRLAENAQNHSSTEDVLLEFLNYNNFNQEDLIVLAQITSPFTTKEDINSALKQLKKEGSDSLLSATLTKRFFWDKKSKTPLNYDYNKRPRRQDFEGLYMENGAFYINTISNIIENQNRLSGKISIYEMSEESAFEIDEEIDWVIAEKLMKSLNKRN